jgi:hypothetical protein
MVEKKIWCKKKLVDRNFNPREWLISEWEKVAILPPSYFIN